MNRSRLPLVVLGLSEMFATSLGDYEFGDKRESVDSSRGDYGEPKRVEEAAVESRELPLPTIVKATEGSSPPDYKELVKVILLGAPAVGKTSIIQQFVWNEFCDTHYPTDRRHTYYPSVVINGRLYDLKISDLPPVPYFPVDSLYEWTDFRSYGLRSATAYVLVFDLSNAAETFRHLKCLREQMAGSRDMKNVPVVVVGNKHDLLRVPRTSPQHGASSSHIPGSFIGVPCFSQSSLGLPGMSLSLSNLSPQVGQIMTHAGPSRPNAVLTHQQKQHAIALAESRERRDIATIVQKHWRCGYVECSAKYNWRIVAVFKELMQAVDALEWKGTEGGDDNSTAVTGEGSEPNRVAMTIYRPHHHGTSIVPDTQYPALERNRCNVF
ncbi:hypothetical protein J437_LFUL000470 [Ladona fulva]|uniref:Ras-like protein family member 10B n=1 Tax=Ladona fulva TaxID=123851 RepID=A0A8K0KKS1_LADFU|nr:hypothetical protein J437_LFUL000470 [Ladona fulva]